MTVLAPHFLLFSEARTKRAKATATPCDSGTWHFVLEAIDGTAKLEVADEEPEAIDAERLELLAVVRGLEALDQPSKVTLVTRSRSVTRGLRFGIDKWRENGWNWECFGKMSPIKDHDLWQRVDQALQFHDVRCRLWRFDPPRESAPEPKFVTHRKRASKPVQARPTNRLANVAKRLGAYLQGFRAPPGRSSARIA